MDTELKIARSRTQALIRAPFYGAVLMGLPSEKATGQTETMATDGKRVLYESVFVDGLTEDELLFVNCHEALHVAFCHHLRRGERDAKLWNIATDYAINILLSDASIGHMPAGGLLNPDYRDMSAERIYDLLRQEQEQGGAGQGDGTGTEPCPWGEVTEPTNDDGSPLSAEQVEAMEADISQRIIAAADRVREAGGDLPDAVSELIEELMTPKVDWCDVLRRFAGGEQPDGVTYQRVNRKHFHHGRMIMPSIDRIGCGHIVVGIDSSASLSKPELAQFVSELSAVTEELSPESVTVIVCDTRIREVHHYGKGDIIDALNIEGRGGTKVTPVFEYIDEHGLDVDSFIYFTDLHVRDFPAPPSFPTLWVSTGADKAPFGEIVKLD
tara:strand:- start:531 stop:1679 length:1149 start_codon:yes stop_codon:yes gene_type:complete